MTLPAQILPEAAPVLLLAAQKLALLLCRVAGLFSLSPLGPELVPGRVRAAVALIVALALFPVTPAPALSGQGGGFVIALLTEAAMGLVAGLCARLPLLCVEAGVQVISVSAGLGIASLLDPGSDEEVHALTELIAYAALVLFFATGGHHQLLLALHRSLEQVPLGAAHLDRQTALSILGLGSELLALVVQVAAPVMLVTLVLNLALALISRAAPAVNIFSVSLAAVLLVGMVTLIKALPVLGAAMRAAGGWAASLFLLAFGL
jgi:flagellar biosynthetic protein FliR